MTKTTVKIEGMMCHHCEAHMEEEFKKAFPVKKVTASFENSNAEVISKEPISEDEIKKAVENAGYKFISMSSEDYVKKGLFF